MTTDKPSNIEQHIVRQLEAEREGLNHSIQMRLDRARHQAQSEKRAIQRKFSPWPWVATAAVASLATVIVIQLDSPTMPQPPASLDLDLLTMTEFDLLDQEPEFMTWLAEQRIEDLADEAAPHNGES